MARVIIARVCVFQAMSAIGLVKQQALGVKPQPHVER